MSTTWQAPGLPPCTHRRCSRSHWAGLICAFGAFAALGWFLVLPSIPGLVTLAVLGAATFTAAAWPCPSRLDDLMAVADAVREDHEPVYVPSYIPDGWPERYLP